MFTKACLLNGSSASGTTKRWGLVEKMKPMGMSLEGNVRTDVCLCHFSHCDKIVTEAFSRRKAHLGSRFQSLTAEKAEQNSSLEHCGMRYHLIFKGSLPSPN